MRGTLKGIHDEKELPGYSPDNEDGEDAVYMDLDRGDLIAEQATVKHTGLNVFSVVYLQIIDFFFEK